MARGFSACPGFLVVLCLVACSAGAVEDASPDYSRTLPPGQGKKQETGRLDSPTATDNPSAMQPGTDDGSLTIARRALQAWPAGEWTLSGALSTRLSSRDPTANEDEEKNRLPQSGAFPIQMEFHALPGGVRQMIYRAEREEGVWQGLRLNIPRDLVRKGIELLDDATGKPVRDAQALFLDSVFSFEDLALRFLSWPKQEMVDQELLKDRDCWRILSRPSEKDATPYARVESWIDQEYHVLLRAIAYDREDRVVKEFNVRSFQQMEETWMLRTLEVSAPLMGARSRLEILDGRKHTAR